VAAPGGVTVENIVDPREAKIAQGQHTNNKNTEGYDKIEVPVKFGPVIGGTEPRVGMDDIGIGCNGDEGPKAPTPAISTKPMMRSIKKIKIRPRRSWVERRAGLVLMFIVSLHAGFTQERHFHCSPFLKHRCRPGQGKTTDSGRNRKR
jgi:hypothetical protein